MKHCYVLYVLLRYLYLSSQGSTAYVTQRPWILEGSFRDNILLYQVYNEERFNKICHACHLAGVISTLPHGTRTHIAPHVRERGRLGLTVKDPSHISHDG